ncbi:hypothetical protein S7335_5607 [Synechococcus sp. PCC 7335]|nr:hypothetical protein S7335_5607 [Synechococcus sp. PCC 7335]
MRYHGANFELVEPSGRERSSHKQSSEQLIDIYRRSSEGRVM